MKYIYKILVIDDTNDIKQLFKHYEIYLEDKGLLTQFTLASTQKEVEKESNNVFDILMVDYNLRNGFSYKGSYDGTDFIKNYREKNKISKIIFYSSEFICTEMTNEYKLDLTPKEIFNLVNKYKVDSIISKNNFNMVVDTIASNLRDLDPIAKLLIDTKEKYIDDFSKLTYIDSNNEEIDISKLLIEYQKDSEVGKEFRQQIMSTIITSLLKYKY